MIIWITGNMNAGKTTLARELNKLFSGIILDGNEMREVWPGLTLSKEDRITHNIRVANLAKELESQGHNIYVATICPYKDLRERVKKICNCKFIYLSGGEKPSEAYPYEER